MRLATIRTAEGTRAVRIDATHATDLDLPGVDELLQLTEWAERAAAADGRQYDLAGIDYAPLVRRPGKIICVGLNYRSHIAEMGREQPEFPTLFAKFADALIGAYDPIRLPAGSIAMDWEAELAVIIGAPVRNAEPDEARAAVAGVSVLNDVTARDWQYRSTQWLQGKTFEATTPLGPWLVTDPLGPHRLSCEVDGRVVQDADTGDLVFDPAALVSYVSRIITLRPGDVLATGTPGGVGHAENPPTYLHDGSVVVTRIEGVGECRNVCRRD